MNDVLLHLRVIENKDWAILLFVFTFAIIAITKSVFENRFADFSRMIYSDKYVKIYRDSSHLKSGFTIALFIVQTISLSFYIFILLTHFGYATKTDWMVYIQILNLLVYFILSKYLIEKIISTSFNIEEFMEQFNLQKVTYRTYVGVLLLPINLFLYYFDFVSNFFLQCITISLLAFNVLIYLLAIKNYQKIIFRKLFYFILYLCAFEIAPYYFIYYWLTKGIT